ncbi:peptidase [Dictyobacter arantiisoli]|uniref:Peptidase n=2 Tax=Dictyobacter arantiisoli TaxID=2014874 RepID=A0A5A5TAS3_9CHLR|nr:peptidase [Dictyobacter arantiisoli]
MLARVTIDHFGVPTIHAPSRLIAFRTLGYMVARHRLFQLDLLRRLTAGNLSEIVGKAAVDVDINQRVFGFRHVAREVIKRLPEEQIAVLQAYAEGINMYMQQIKVYPPEFLALRYTPKRWEPEDSILVGLYLFQNLTADEEEFERMMTVMEASLPAEVVRFLTPDEDAYMTALAGGQEPLRPSQKIPIDALNILRQRSKSADNTLPSIEEMNFAKGSNGWVVGHNKTHDGRAILANDIHLDLSAPNIWYKVHMHYEDAHLSGFVVPGLPIMTVGSNQYVAWGYTVMHSDVLDLVTLELSSEHPDEYKTPDGWQPFIMTEEVIQVKGQEDIHVTCKATIWGPVLPKPLLNQHVALHWTALDPQAVDIGLLDMDKVQTLNEAIRVVNEFGGPPMNVMLADDDGHIAWTFCGKLPLRKGHDGLSARVWKDGNIGWDGYIAADELPRVIDPPADFLVTANNRTLGTHYPYSIGYNFVSGYRAYAISQKLQAQEHVTEREMFDLQLDTTTTFYDFYRSLLQDVLTPEVLDGQADLTYACQLIADWDGEVRTSSTGFPILYRFREVLIKEILPTYLAPCKEKEESFVYRWGTMETPLRQLLKERIPETLPYPDTYSSWDDLCVCLLQLVINELKKECKTSHLDGITWGKINICKVRHPLAAGIPFAARILNMPYYKLPGCDFTIRVAQPKIGVSVRFVLSPGEEAEALWNMPCGQSGYPLSYHYKDLHRFWMEGMPLPFYV